MTYKKSQEIRQIGVLNEHPELFSNDPGMGEYKRIPRPFAVKDGINNLYSPMKTLGFTKFNITWVTKLL